MGCFIAKEDLNHDLIQQQNIKQNANNITTRENSLHQQTNESTDNFDSIIIDFDVNSKQTLSRQDFTFLRVLGRGTFGKVYLVQNKISKQYYALKIIKKRQLILQKQKEQLNRERKILERMSHPFIVNLCFAFQTDKQLFFGTEVVLGGELFLHLKKSQRFSERRAKFYLAQIVLTMEYLHANGIIYRDLKPENILLEQDGYIKLTDFGLSKEVMEKQGTTYTFCGTPEYLAPEIIFGKGYTQSVDWWSLGVLLYEMLSGQSPFYSKNTLKTFESIMEKDIEMKSYFSDSAKSLLNGLMCPNAKLRLGGSGTDAAEIKSHPFFNNIDWSKMYNKKYTAPYKPEISGPVDIRNFDTGFTDEPIEDTPCSIQALLTAKPENYQGFTFIKHSLINCCNNDKIESKDWLEEDY